MSLLEQEPFSLTGTYELTPDFIRVRAAQSLVFCVVFCESFFLSFLFLSNNQDDDTLPIMPKNSIGKNIFSVNKIQKYVNLKNTFIFKVTDNN